MIQVKSMMSFFSPHISHLDKQLGFLNVQRVQLHRPPRFFLVAFVVAFVVVTAAVLVGGVVLLFLFDDDDGGGGGKKAAKDGGDALLGCPLLTFDSKDEGCDVVGD